jgi:integrase
LRHVHTLLRNALNDAYRMELVTRNVAGEVKAPPKPREGRRELTVEEAKRFLAVLEGERLKAFFVLALATGLRRGELLGLHWLDVDLDAGELRTGWAVQRVNGSLQLVNLKTESSRRTVAIPAFAVRALREHKAQQNAERLELGPAWREQGLVFTTSLGTPIEPRNVNRRFELLRKRAGLEWLRLHDLRHGTATFMQMSLRRQLTHDHGGPGALGDRRHDEHLHARVAGAAARGCRRAGPALRDR